MSSSRQFTFFDSKPGWVLLLLLLTVGCTIPKKYQKDKPFVYKSTVTLISNQKGSEKVQLRDRLISYLDDSLQVRTVLGVRLIPPFFYYRLLKPPVFDSLAIDRSKTFMNGLLNAEGYFNPVIRDTFTIDTIGDQMRVKVDFNVNAGKQFILDSVGYDLETPELQALTEQNMSASLLKKNQPFSIEKISADRDRLINLFRNHGYYKLTREDLFAERDTVVAALIDPTLDPFEQFRLIDSLQKRRHNPTINVTMKQRIGKDSSHLLKYYIGDISVYPDLPILQDTLAAESKASMVDGYRMIYSTDKFKLPFIARNIFLKKGALYRQEDYYNTINKFSNFGAWQQVDIDLTERMDSVPLLDATIRLFPARKQTLNIDFETSRNASDVLTTGSLFGIGLNLGVTNRNAFRESIQTNSNIRFGVELGTRVVQTVQTGLSYKIAIPRYIKPFQFLNLRNFTNPRTIIDFNTTYTLRRSFFEVRSVNTSFGIEGTRRNHTWQWIPFNVEYTNVRRLGDSLANLEKRIPSLRQAFNNGLILSQVIAYNNRRVLDNHLKFFRTKLESSGGLAGLITNLDKGSLRRFLRLDAEYKYFVNYPKSTWAFRTYAGYGYVYGKSGDTMENNLPFFKAFFAGGPYSMRAWQVRRLGLGSSAIYDTVKADRFGDIQLEANVEYRFNVATIAGVKLKSALFVDVGNIWGKAFDKDGNKIPETQFNFGRLYKDLAVGAGTSVRFDFDFFLIRLDWAYQLKNPVFKEKNGWFQNISVGNGQFQLGIGYPF
ncbi:MAG TPA: BamA/TamA family outer membrane protein [Flavitalea sp.]|nr:BamA/TamA family outer membrane protein [Flavitalea sp.]